MCVCVCPPIFRGHLVTWVTHKQSNHNIAMSMEHATTQQLNSNCCCQESCSCCEVPAYPKSRCSSKSVSLGEQAKRSGFWDWVKEESMTTLQRMTRLCKVTDSQWENKYSSYSCLCSAVISIYYITYKLYINLKNTIELYNLYKLIKYYIIYKL